MIRVIAYKQLGNRSFIDWLRFVKTGDETKTTTNNVVSTIPYEGITLTVNSVPVRWENVHGVETPICRDCGFIPNKKYEFKVTGTPINKIKIKNPLKDAKLIEVDSREEAIRNVKGKEKKKDKLVRLKNLLK